MSGDDLPPATQQLDGTAHRNPGDAVQLGQLCLAGEPGVWREPSGINVSFNVRSHLDRHSHSRVMVDSGRSVLPGHEDHARCPVTCEDAPVGILFVAVLHFVTAADDPYGIVETFKQAMAKGSFLALSHIVRDGTGLEVIAGVQEAYAKASAPAVFRTEAEIRRFFEGFDLERPGLVDVAGWFPYNRVFSAKPPTLRFLSGVGRKS